MDELEDPQWTKKYVFMSMEAEIEVWDPIKLAKAHLPPPPPHLHTHTNTPVIYYWTIKGGTFSVVLFVKCFEPILVIFKSNTA